MTKQRNGFMAILTQWKLRDIVLSAILAVVAGALYLVFDLFVPSMLNPIAQGLVNGIWWIVAGFAAYIIRRPGAALFAELVGAFCEFAFGSPYGSGAILSGLLQGGGAEIGYAIFGWKRYNLGVMILSGAIGGLGNAVQWYVSWGGNTYSVAGQIEYVVCTMISGAFFAGLLPRLIVNALKRTGVLRNYAISKQVQG